MKQVMTATVNEYFQQQSELLSNSKWMLHTGGGWGETPPPPMIVKCFGCTAIHNKALYKCIHSFIHSANRNFII